MLCIPAPCLPRLHQHGRTALHDAAIQGNKEATRGTSVTSTSQVVTDVSPVFSLYITTTIMQEYNLTFLDLRYIPVFHYNSNSPPTLLDFVSNNVHSFNNGRLASPTRMSTPIFSPPPSTHPILSGRLYRTGAASDRQRSVSECS